MACIIPVDIVYQIIRELDDRDLVYFISTCKRINNMWKKDIIALLDPYLDWKKKYIKIRYHRFLRVFRFDRADEHTVFVISAYNGESVTVSQYIEKIRKKNISDLVSIKMFGDWPVSAIPLSANILHDSMSAYILYMHHKNIINDSVSVIRLALHASLIGNNLKIFKRLLQILYPTKNICECDENIRASDQELWADTFTWQINIALYFAMCADSRDIVNYLIEMDWPTLELDDDVTIDTASIKGYIEILERYTDYLDLYSNSFSIHALTGAAINKKKESLHWWLDRFGHGLDELLNNSNSVHFLSMYVYADMTIIDWWKRSGLFVVYIVIGDIFRYLKSFKNRQIVLPINDPYNGFSKLQITVIRDTLYMEFETNIFGTPKRYYSIFSLDGNSSSDTVIIDIIMTQMERIYETINTKSSIA